jgi:hypothetical protein
MVSVVSAVSVSQFQLVIGLQPNEPNEPNEPIDRRSMVAVKADTDTTPKEARMSFMILN